MFIALKQELERIKETPDIQAVIITGSGDRAFSAGADIEYLNMQGLVNRVTEPENLRTKGEKLLDEILDNTPVAVNLTWGAIIQTNSRTLSDRIINTSRH